MNYIDVNLPASDEEYVIYVYNWGNETYNPSSDYKKFKILKINSTVSMDPVLDMNYGQNATLSFAGDGTSYNITVYDSNNEIVFSKITNETSMNISDLDAGEYNVTIINLGNENTEQSMVSTMFYVNKLVNNFKVKVDEGVYGHDTTITVTADVDGDYNVDINSRIITVYVENGHGTKTIDDFGAGNYTAKVSFDNDNYINNATDCNFTIQKGQSHVGIVDLDENVTMNQNKSIRFTDFYPAKYNVTIYDSNYQIVKSEIWDSLLYNVLISDVGTYNLTVTNLGNDNVTGSTASSVFNVVADNYVDVYVEDSEYGRELYIAISANVDGEYIVNLNGTEITVEVIDGTGEFCDLVDINAGDYTTEVIFDNPDYNNIINNTNFTIYPVESNIKIYEIGNVSYGKDINVRFHENYPTVFYIEVIDSNNETVANTTFVYEDTSPEMNVIFSDLDIGEYMVVIENLGDDVNIYGNSASMYFNVTNAPVLIELEDKIKELEEKIANLTAHKETSIVIDPIDNVKYGDEIVISGLLLNDESISISNQVVTVKFNDEKVDLTTRNGEFKYTTTVTTVGENTVTVSYAGKDKYNPSEATTTFTSQKADININLDEIEAVKKGKTITITATVTDHNNKPMADSVIKILINNGRKTLKTDSEGRLSFNYTLTKVGQNNITVTFQENKYYNEAIENMTVEVLPLNTYITINPINSVAKGQNITITGTLTDENGDKIANAQVKVIINGSPKTLKTDANGVFTHTYTMGKTGENNISVTYAGSNSYISSEASTTVEVSKTESVIIIDSLGTINKGDNVTISGKITDKNNNAIANAQVKITINGSPKTVKSDSNGVFVYNYIMNRLGDNDITVIFNGNNNFLATNTTSIVNVVKAS